MPAKFKTVPKPLPKLTAADRKLLAWVDRLGLPRLEAKQPFVLARLPLRPEDQGSSSIRYYTGYEEMAGFLLADEARTLVVSHGLWPVTYVSSYAAKRLTRKVDPAAYAAWLGGSKQLAKRDPRAPRIGLSRLTRRQAHPSQALEAVLLARLLAQRKREGAAALLLRHARCLERDLSPRALRPALGRVLLWEVIAACASPHVSWRALLQRFDLIARGFAGEEAAREAGKYRKVLAAMTAKTQPAPVALPAAAELGRRLLDLNPSGQEAAVIRLRETNRAAINWLRYLLEHPRSARRGMPPGGVYAFIRSGIRAIPRLLSLLGDDRLTRARSPRKRDAQGTVLRYGDVALQLVSVVAGRRFTVADEARAWWRKVKTKGHATVLAEMAAEAKYDAPGLLARLLEQDRPRGLRVAGRVLPRLAADRAAALLCYVGRHRGSAATDLLRSVLWRERRPTVWKTAAQQLVGRPLWEDHLLAAIRARRSVYAGDLVTTLLQRGNPRALRGLAKLYDVLKPKERRALLSVAKRARADGSLRSLVAQAVVLRARSR